MNDNSMNPTALVATQKKHKSIRFQWRGKGFKWYDTSDQTKIAKIYFQQANQPQMIHRSGGIDKT